MPTALFSPSFPPQFLSCDTDVSGQCQMFPGRAKSLLLKRACDKVVNLSFLTTHLQAHYLVDTQRWSQRPKGKWGERVLGFASGGWVSSFLNVSLYLYLNSVVKSLASKVSEWLLIRGKIRKYFNWLFKNKNLYIKCKPLKWCVLV